MSKFGVLTYAEKPSWWSNVYHPPHRLVPRMTPASAWNHFDRMIREDSEAIRGGFSEIVREPSFLVHPNDYDALVKIFDELGTYPEPNFRRVVDLWSFEAYRMAGNGD